MKLSEHYDLKGKHSLLSPSQSRWLRYDDEKLIKFANNSDAAQLGTDLHAWACEAIRLGLRQSKSKNALYMYINDAIKLRMKPEVTLYYSPYCFGTVDAILFENGLLRIHDLKTGTVGVYESNHADMEQLLVYTALFCLEYFINPSEIDIELRVYQGSSAIVYVPSTDEIVEIMSTIEHHSAVITDVKENQ